MVMSGRPDDAPQMPIRKGRNNNCMHGFVRFEKRRKKTKNAVFANVRAFRDFLQGIRKILQCLQKILNALQIFAQAMPPFLGKA